MSLRDMVDDRLAIKADIPCPPLRLPFYARLNLPYRSA
jgi:hypothetical protein